MESAPPPKPPTLAQEWGVIVFSVVFLAVLVTVLHPPKPENLKGRNITAGGFIVGIAGGAAHAVWISTSLRRHGRRIGAWRFFGFFMGPIATILHLTLTYRLRAIYMIPLYFAVLAALVCLVAVLSLVVPQ